MKYLLDSNTFIEAKNRYYSFDLCPGFWHWLEKFPDTNGALTITQVKQEILDGKDELSDWLKKQPSKFFIDSDTSIQQKARVIIQFIEDNYSKKTEKDKFIAGADLWLIATAMQLKQTIVTMEVAVHGQTQKIKIPNICQNFNIQCINIYDLLRLEKISFGLR